MEMSKTRFWRAVYTKPRSEKKVAERLEKQGLEVYCPLQTTLKQWSDRKKKVSVPIFPSYVFIKLEEIEREQVLVDPGIVNFVYWLGKPAVIRDDEMDQLKSFLSDNKDNKVTARTYSPGEKVEIVSGPFKGERGSVGFIKRGKLTVLIESLGMMVNVEVNSDTVLGMNT